MSKQRVFWVVIWEYFDEDRQRWRPAMEGTSRREAQSWAAEARHHDHIRNMRGPFRWTEPLPQEVKP